MVVTAGKLGDAERSPKVHYANYKEKIVLKKNLDILNRTENNIVHRVKIDQKILYKRFQDKLHRSKLAYARMYGDKETERELRARNLRSLNINIGDDEHDYDFLKKIQPAQDKKSSTSLKVKINIDTESDDVFQDERKTRTRSKSLSEEMSTALPVTIKTKAIAKRPSSARNAKRAKSITFTPEEVDSVKQSNKPKNNLLSVPRIDTRPRTCSPKLPMSLNRRNSSVSKENDDKSAPRSPRRSTNLFENEESVDYVEMRLNELKRLDYTQKMEDFCESIEKHKSDSTDNIDYYTMRLSTSDDKSKITNEIPGTPDEQYQKHYGNLAVKSLTMKKLNFDFSKSDSSQSHLFTPDASAMLRYDSFDEESESDED